MSVEEEKRQGSGREEVTRRLVGDDGVEWPAPPSYFLSGGPWIPPRIPAKGQRKRSAFNLLLVPDAAVPTSSSDSSSSSSSSSAAGAGLGLPPASADLKHELEDLFGRGGAEVGHIAELFASLLESLAKRESGYKESVDRIQRHSQGCVGLLRPTTQLAIETIEDCEHKGPSGSGHSTAEKHG